MVRWLWQKTKSHRVRIVILVLFGLLILLGIVNTTRAMDREFTSQLHQSLMDVASQNALVLQHRVAQRSELLVSIRRDWGLDGGSMTQELLEMDQVVQLNRLKRLGVCTPDGMTHSTDGVRVDLSRREFFQAGLQGRNCISDILEDAMAIGAEPELVTVMSQPMLDEAGNVTGVFCLTYDAEDFSNQLMTTCYDGRGFALAVNEQGHVVVSGAPTLVQLRQDLFKDVLTADRRNAQEALALHAAMEQMQTRIGELWLDQAYEYAARPIMLMDGDVTWYSITLVPQAVLLGRRTTMAGSLRWTLILGVGMMLCAIAALATGHTLRQRAMRELAYRDPLTRGENYAGFTERMQKLGARAGWVVSMDISGYKNVNLALGQERGDEMLVAIWKLIRSSVYKGECAGRVRDDHFVLFIAGTNDEVLHARIGWIIERIDRLFAQYNVPALRPCFGIMAVAPGDSLDDAHNKAKIAREFVKAQKNRCYAFFTDSDYARLMEEQHIQEEIASALTEGRFEAWYQPKYGARTEQLMGAEALVRWRNERNELVTPIHFISFLERNGTIAKLDEYMFRTVCRQLRAWMDKGLPALPVSVNLSRASSYKMDVVQRYVDIVREYGLTTDQVQIEITETAIAGNEFVSAVVSQFRQRGFRVLMDDFGSGYSSLAQLNKSFDVIKLDKSLIDRVGEESGEMMIKSVIQLIHGMGLNVTAEGVEKREQVEYLRGADCDEIQGYYFGRPMPAEEFERVLADSHSQVG